MSGPTRLILRLWYCHIRRAHDWWTFGVGKPYEFKVCSLCDQRRHDYALFRGNPPPGCA